MALAPIELHQRHAATPRVMAGMHVWAKAKDIAKAAYDLLSRHGIVTSRPEADLDKAQYAKYNGSLDKLAFKTCDDSVYSLIVSQDVSAQAHHQGDRASGQLAVSLPR